MEIKTIHIVVKGKVQGVYFRQGTRELAVKLGLSGYVRNLSDGSVEIVAKGDNLQLDQLLSWCRTGPPLARVEKVETEEHEPFEGTEFIIRK